MRALDQAGYVGEDEVAPVDPDHAETWMEGGERIVRDFGLGGGAGGEERRFARVRQADETRVGDQLQPQKERALDALETRIGAPWRAVGRGGEMEVAEAAGGEGLGEGVKWRFPSPPLPPWATTTRSPGSVMSTSIAPLSSSKTCVPTGTFSTASAPRPPALLRPIPCIPILALKCCWYRKSISV